MTSTATRELDPTFDHPADVQQQDSAGIPENMLNAVEQYLAWEIASGVSQVNALGGVGPDPSDTQQIPDIGDAVKEMQEMDDAKGKSEGHVFNFDPGKDNFSQLIEQLPDMQMAQVDSKGYMPEDVSNLGGLVSSPSPAVGQQRDQGPAIG